MEGIETRNSEIDSVEIAPPELPKTKAPETPGKPERYDDCEKNPEAAFERKTPDGLQETDEAAENYEDCSLKATARAETGEAPEVPKADLYSDCRLAPILEEPWENDAQAEDLLPAGHLSDRETWRVETEAVGEAETTAETEPGRETEAARETDRRTNATPEAHREDNMLTLQEASAQRDFRADELRELSEKKSAADKNADELFRTTLSLERGTEEYERALSDYNAARDRSDVLQERILVTEEQKSQLDERVVFIREAQLTKGWRASENSERLIAESTALERRCENAAFNGNLSAEELSELRGDTLQELRQLSAQRDSLKLGMEAKSSEISDYVTRNGLTPNSSGRDAEYCRMAGEYQTLRNQYREANYHVTRLDANAIELSKMTGTDYVSVLDRSGSPIEAVNRGRDVPGETDYFPDKAEERTALEPFEQRNWEKLTQDERKECIGRLAEHHASVLNLEEPPKIQYYAAKDRCDCGFYLHDANTIYLNSNNLDNASETADTLSHEYRHCYQHTRAEKLENERDLAFKEGFDDYIQPEDDYAAYREQLVERDAWAYGTATAERVVPNEETRVDKALTAAEATHPEEGAELREGNGAPPDAEALRLPREMLEVRELQELRERVAPCYENGKRIAARIPQLDSYKEHHELNGGHIEKVHSKSIEAADVLEKSFRKDDHDGLYSPEINRRELEAMALYHDTGMDGNIDAGEYDSRREQFLADPERRAAYVEAEVGKGNPPGEAERRFERSGYEEHFRGEHSLQSAVHVLRDREVLESKGLDADRVALGCMLHSKSTSGVENLADDAQWETAIGRIDNEVARFNRDHPDEQIRFSSASLRGEDDRLDDSALAGMRSECLCLRIGDANGHDSASRVSQNGKPISFRLDDWDDVQRRMKSDLGESSADSKMLDYRDEAKYAVVSIDGELLDDAGDPSAMGRMYAVGEGNFRSVSLMLRDGVPTEHFVLEKAEAYPLSTQNCIMERIREINTAKVQPNAEIERLSGMSDVDYEKYVQDQRNSMQKVNMDVSIDIGNADSGTRASYNRFADSVLRKYGIRVKLSDPRN